MCCFLHLILQDRRVTIKVCVKRGTGKSLVLKRSAPIAFFGSIEARALGLNYRHIIIIY